MILKLYMSFYEKLSMTIPPDPCELAPHIKYNTLFFFPRYYNLVWSIPKAVPCMIIPRERLDKETVEKFDNLIDKNPIGVRYFGYDDK